MASLCSPQCRSNVLSIGSLLPGLCAHMPGGQRLNDFSAGGHRGKSLLLGVSGHCLLLGMGYLVVTLFCRNPWD